MTLSEIVIEPLKEDDIPCLMNLCKESPPALSVEQYQKYVMSLKWGPKTMRIFVAKINSTVVGELLAMEGSPRHFNAHILARRHIYVAHARVVEHSRQQGVGKALSNFLLAEARADGISLIRTEADGASWMAATYLRNGFSRVPCLIDNKNDYDATGHILLEMNLDHDD